MNVLIVEDEQLAALKLQKALNQIQPEIEILSIEESVSGVVKWLENNPDPDLMFLDIQLADGVSFEIFKTIKKPIPVIFITAFDEYTLQAFRLNSIDYILKPFNTEDIKRALEKFDQVQSKRNYKENLEAVMQSMQERFQKNYKSRFFVKQNSNLHSIPTEEVSHFESQEGLVVLINNMERKFAIDYSLEDLEKCLDPDLFFRANRQVLINFSAIKSMKPFGQSRIQVHLKNKSIEPFLISRARTKDFKDWLDR